MADKEPKDRKAYYRAYYQTHKEKINEYRRTWWATRKERYNEISKCWYQRRKLEVLEHYSNGALKCARCNIDDIDVLCLDHINNDGAKERRRIGRGGIFYRWLQKQGYPEGYQVLCRNCNWKKQLQERYR